MAEKKPNLMLLVVDCLRADRAYGLAGNSRTVATDALRKRGFTFETAVSSASNTTPSFASMLSSLFGFHHGVRSLRGYKLKDHFPTLPEVLKQAGYHTYAEASGPLVAENRLDRGFDEYVYRTNFEGVFSSYFKRLKRRVENDLREPWFLMFHIWSLHRPRKILPGWNTPEYGDALYDRSWSSVDDRIGEFLESVPENTVIAFTGDHGERTNEGDKDPESWRVVSRFPFLEATIDLIHHKRKRRRQRHKKRRGEYYGPPGGACHGFHIYDDLVHVPLVFTGPGVPQGGSAPDLVRHVDIGPTLLDLAGVDAPAGFGKDGRSLAPFLRGERIETVPAYLEATGQNPKSTAKWIASVRTEKMKYCRGLLKDDLPEELYDLVSDPTEQENLAQDDPRVSEMRKLFDEFVPDLAREDIDTTLTKEEIADLDDTLRALGYLS